MACFLCVSYLIQYEKMIVLVIELQDFAGATDVRGRVERVDADEPDLVGQGGGVGVLHANVVVGEAADESLHVAVGL